LGWNNSAKVAALETKRRQLETELAEVGSQISVIQKERGELTIRLDALTKLEELTSFDELDWSGIVTEIAQLVDERNSLEAASDVLKQLNDSLRALQKMQKETADELQAAREKRARVEQQRADAQELRERTHALLHHVVINEELLTRLQASQAEALGEHQLTVESCDNREQDVRALSLIHI
jgi:uncharacterized protein YPO0396